MLASSFQAWACALYSVFKPEFTYPDAEVKSPQSDVALCCWLCCGTVDMEPKLPMSGKGAWGWKLGLGLLPDAGDAPAPGGGASLGAKPPGGGGMTPNPPPAIRKWTKIS